MTSITRSFVGAWVGVFVIGCGEPQPGDTDGVTTVATGSSSGGGVSMSETGEPTTADIEPTSGSASATGTSATGSSTGEASTTGATSGTTGELVCTLEEQACAAAGQLGPFMDCGAARLDDAVEIWQAAHDCALANAGAQMPFKLIVELQGIDSEVGEAYVGVAARSYALSRFFFDGDPCGGGGCGPVVGVQSCATLTAVMGCTVEVGSVCLGCDGAGEATQVCGPE